MHIATQKQQLNTLGGSEIPLIMASLQLTFDLDMQRAGLRTFWHFTVRAGMLKGYARYSMGAAMLHDGSTLPFWAAPRQC